MPGIEEALKQAFQSQLERIPQHLRAVVAGDQRKQFLVTRYFAIIREVLCSEAVPEPFRFEPEVAIGSISDTLLREHARHVLSRVCEAHVLLISQILERAYAKEFETVPQYLRKGLDESLRQQFLSDQYISIVSCIVSGTHLPIAFRWAPALSIHRINDAAARQSAQELCLLVGPHDVPLIEKSVAQRFEADTACIDRSIFAVHAETLRANWMLQNYFVILSEVICGAPRTPPDSYDFGSLRPAASAAASLAPSSNIASPKKRARCTSLLRPTAAAPVVKTAQQLHTQDLSGSDSVRLTAAVLNHSDQPRWDTVTDRKTKAQSQVPVVSVMLADASGPIF